MRLRSPRRRLRGRTFRQGWCAAGLISLFTVLALPATVRADVFALPTEPPRISAATFAQIDYEPATATLTLGFSGGMVALLPPSGPPPQFFSGADLQLQIAVDPAAGALAPAGGSFSLTATGADGVARTLAGTVIDFAWRNADPQPGGNEPADRFAFAVEVTQDGFGGFAGKWLVVDVPVEYPAGQPYVPFQGDFTQAFSSPRAKVDMATTPIPPNCDDVEALLEGCVLVPPPSGDNDCQGRITELVLEYTGGGCADSSHSQDPDKVVCSGDAGGIQPVRVVVRDTRKHHDITYLDDNEVWIGDWMTVSGEATGKGKIGPNTEVIVCQWNGCRWVEIHRVSFHTSCSQPLNVGDIFGAFRVVAMTTTEGGSVSIDQGADGEDCVTAFDFGGCDCPCHGEQPGDGGDLPGGDLPGGGGVIGGDLPGDGPLLLATSAGDRERGSDADSGSDRDSDGGWDSDSGRGSDSGGDSDSGSADDSDSDGSAPAPCSCPCHRDGGDSGRDSDSGDSDSGSDSGDSDSSSDDSARGSDRGDSGRGSDDRDSEWGSDDSGRGSDRGDSDAGSDSGADSDSARGADSDSDGGAGSCPPCREPRCADVTYTLTLVNHSASYPFTNVEVRVVPTGELLWTIDAIAPGASVELSTVRTICEPGVLQLEVTGQLGDTTCTHAAQAEITQAPRDDGGNNDGGADAGDSDAGRGSDSGDSDSGRGSDSGDSDSGRGSDRADSGRDRSDSGRGSEARSRRRRGGDGWRGRDRADSGRRGQQEARRSRRRGGDDGWRGRDRERDRRERPRRRRYRRR